MNTIDKIRAKIDWKKVHTYTEELREGDMEKMLLDLSVGKGKRETKIALPDKVVDALEKPDKSLEEAAEKYAYQGIPDEMKSYVKPIGDEVIKNFKAGAEWMKAKMMEEAVEGRVISNDGISFPVSNEIHRLELIEGDKVRIIILPKEDGE